MKKERSLTVILSGITGAIIIAVVSLFYLAARTAILNLAEKSYLNQLDNMNRQAERQLIAFYDSNIKSAEALAAMPEIINATRTGNFEQARGILTEYFNKRGIFENLFISSPDNESHIYIASIRKSDGLKWGDIPVYHDNAVNTTAGKVHISSIAKSPVTGMTVILITVPIRFNDRVIGMIGMPLDVGSFSRQMVKGVKIGTTGYMYVTDLKGTTIAHPVEENIHKIHIGDYDWGKKVLSSPSHASIFYSWKGVDKVQTFIRNEKHGFIVAATMNVDDYVGQIRRTEFVLIPLAVILAAISIVAVYLFMSRRLAPLRKCKEVLGAVSSGDLTMRYTGVINNDEIGSSVRSLNEMVDRIESLIGNVVIMAQSLSSSVSQIAAGNENLSQRTAQQASALEEVVSTIEESMSSMQQNSENSSRAKELAEAGVVKAEEGDSVADQAVSAIEVINESSRRISEIIAVINEIAFQTNLLALNAAVEAARAGEQGRGFAVVAGEVRNLAQRSGNAAQEIEKLIKDAVSKVEGGTDLVKRTGSALAAISESSRKTANLISEIALSIQEQKQGIEQINNAMGDMDNVTQQNASLVEETAAASEAMAKQAQDLMALVDQFKVSRDASKAAEQAASSAVPEKAKPADRGNGRQKPAAGSARTSYATKIPATHETTDEGIRGILKGEGFEEF